MSLEVLDRPEDFGEFLDICATFIKSSTGKIEVPYFFGYRMPGAVSRTPGLLLDIRTVTIRESYFDPLAKGHPFRRIKGGFWFKGEPRAVSMKYGKMALLDLVIQAYAQILPHQEMQDRSEALQRRNQAWNRGSIPPA